MNAIAVGDAGWKLIGEQKSREMKVSVLTKVRDERKKQLGESDKKLKEYEKLILESKIEAKNYFNKAREKILKDVNKKKENIEKEINDEISKAEKEILDLKNKSPEKIRKIAVETSSDLINQLIGIEVNNSSISAIVEDITRKAN